MEPSSEELAQQERKAAEDGSWVNAEILRELLEDGSTVLNIDVQRATGKGDNYLSALYRTRMEYHTVESEEVRALNLIVKGLPPGEFIKSYVEEVGLFRREISMYNDFLPRLYDFANSKLGKGSFKRFSAGFYKISRPDTLVFDDLKPEGFVMAPRRDRLDLVHSKMVVQNLARLHALSVAYEEENPGSIAQYPDIMFCESQRDRVAQFMTPMLTLLEKEIRKWGSFSSIANKLEAEQDLFITKVINASSNTNCPRTVFIHGDSWVNNILFKYSETGQPIDLRFVDFQISCEASPALDLNYFLFTSPRTDVRTLHFENLLQEYCDEFGRCAKDLGYSGAPITFEEIRREMDRTAAFAFMATIWIFVIVLGDPDDTPDLENITEESIENKEHADLFEKVYASSEFREAFEIVVPYFEERGVFD